MIEITIYIVNVIIQVLTLLLLAHVILSFFMSPFHPIREAIDRVMNPFLNPIRNFMPQTGMIDFSPLVLWLLLRVVGAVLITTLASFA